MTITRLDRIRGCLLGGAVGDALGAPVEFDSLEEILKRHPDGVHDYEPAYGRKGAITDDTQMTLFTAEGLILAHEHGVDPVEEVYHAYLRWHFTQSPWRSAGGDGWPRRGWLVDNPDLHQSRAPGGTCLSALGSGKMGTIDRPLNDSKGCGGIMRAAPCGLIGADEPFDLGCYTAAITHGHPSGYWSAAFLADLIDALLTIDSFTLSMAVDLALLGMTGIESGKETITAVDASIARSKALPPTPQAVESLGGGWVGEEALAIALFCSLTATNFEDAVSLAVTHSGDSDSTGSITGQILGALWGVQAIPVRWLQDLDLLDTIEDIALRLANLHVGKYTA